MKHRLINYALTKHAHRKGTISDGNEKHQRLTQNQKPKASHPQNTKP
uniref:Uncharacterized protein n=1 Tax=Rhizophora mucronata TaxID=61149 RepID=A0A2P2Q0M8_RHIMU